MEYFCFVGGSSYLPNYRAVFDVTLRNLPAEGTFWTMQKEIRGLTAVSAGQVLAENVARESWPVAQEGMRARIVVKDFGTGHSARSGALAV